MKTIIQKRIDIIKYMIEEYNKMEQTHTVIICRERAFGELRAYKRVLKDFEEMGKC